MKFLITCYGLQGDLIMTDLRLYIKQNAKTAIVKEKQSVEKIVSFLVANEWFGIEPIITEKKVFLTDDMIAVIQPHIDVFRNTESKSENLIAMLSNKWPFTSKQLIKFFNEENTSESFKFYLTDFLLLRMKKEIFFYTDEEIAELIEFATYDLLKNHGDYLTFFLSWLRSNSKTLYCKDFFMQKRYTLNVQNQAYDFDEYLHLAYLLLNEDYICKNKMFKKASESKDYTDTWLYLSVHFICALRKTDLVRIYHPILPYSPAETIDLIKKDAFSENDARKVLLSITKRMSILPFTPNKVRDVKGVGEVRFHIPNSCEVLFGKLFALAEAHRQLSKNPNEPIIRKISKYEEINRYMGKEIGDLFLESDFRSRSATKSYLQAIYMMADNILEEDKSGPRIKGYILASLARSHKGAYGEFAKSTFEYLKDAKFNGLTPEFVAFELLERGVLSFISSTLLNMVTKKDYEKLSVENQTNLIKALKLSPGEIENIVGVVEKGKKQALDILPELIHSEDNILEILHKLGSGEAISKTQDSLCLLTATGKMCPFFERRNCIGCHYEISTRSTFYLLANEFRRLKFLYEKTSESSEKSKYKQLLMRLVIPKLDEILHCIKENYGEEVFHQYEELIKELIG